MPPRFAAGLPEQAILPATAWSGPSSGPAPAFRCPPKGSCASAPVAHPSTIAAVSPAKRPCMAANRSCPGAFGGFTPSFGASAPHILAAPTGKVVELDGPGAESRASRRGRSRRRPSKTALVLGGGGFTGGVYEIGALRALDLLAVNRTVNQFDVYVGTSAGALIAALAANGVTPEQMMRVVNNQTPTPFRDINLDMLQRPNYREFVRKGVQLPLQLVDLARVIGRNVRALSPV